MVYRTLVSVRQSNNPALLSQNRFSADWPWSTRFHTHALSMSLVLKIVPSVTMLLTKLLAKLVVCRIILVSHKIKIKMLLRIKQFSS